MTGSQETISGLARVLYLIDNTSRFGGFGALLLSSLFAYYHTVVHVNKDKATIFSFTCLCLCTLAYAAYPAPAG